jgi:hypothetical protein
MLQPQPAAGVLRSLPTLVLPLPLSLFPVPASGVTGGVEPLLLLPPLLPLLLPPPLELELLELLLPLLDPDPLPLVPELDPVPPLLEPLLEPELDPLLLPDPLPLLLPLVCLSAVPLGVPQPVGPS